jgi:thioredoxin-like negative regulator of GroEL
MIAKIFNVRSLPTAVFFEDSMPVARMTGLGEADDFLNIVEDVVTRGCHVIDYDRDPSAAQRNFVLSDDDTA